MKDPATGEIVEIHCTYDPATRGGDAPDGRRVKGTIHWLAEDQARPAQVRLYDRLFVKAEPDSGEDGKDFLSNLNPESLVIADRARVESALASAGKGTFFQLERLGYFTVDPESAADRLVFNRSVALRDSWARIEKKTRAG